MVPIYRPFDNIIVGIFVSRPNRFLIECECDGDRVTAFLPNPGRLQELLLPRCRLYLTRDSDRGVRKTRFTVVGVDRNGCPIMLHTHRTNDAVLRLLEERLIPGLEPTTVVRREVAVGHSRFDFLLADEKGEMYVEVKSCTLFGKTVAMFPDAVTERGARHLRELAALSRRGSRSAVIFVAHWPYCRTFMPDYHTDLHFATTLLEVREAVKIVPIAVTWNEEMALSPETHLLPIPWRYVEREARDSGSYILVLELKEDKILPVGRRDGISFRKGFYLYVGSAAANLTARIARHLRLRKKLHWHIDWLRAHASVRAALPIRSSARLECTIADSLRPISDWTVQGFGCSDCSCPSHLFGMARDPLSSSPFLELLQYFGMDRYEEQSTVGPASPGNPRCQA